MCLIVAQSFHDISFSAERSEWPNVQHLPIWNVGKVVSSAPCMKHEKPILIDVQCEKAIISL